MFVAGTKAYPVDGMDRRSSGAGNVLDVFVDGIARGRIKSKPNTLKRAVEIATSERQAARTFDLRRGKS